MIVGYVVGACVPPKRGVLLNIEDVRGGEFALRMVRTEQSMHVRVGDEIQLNGGDPLWFSKVAPKDAVPVPLTRLYIDDAASVGPESLR